MTKFFCLVKTVGRMINDHGISVPVKTKRVSCSVKTYERISLFGSGGAWGELLVKT